MTFITEKSLNDLLPGHRRDDFALMRRFSRDVLALYIAATSDYFSPINHKLLELIRDNAAAEQKRLLLQEYDRLLARALARGWACRLGGGQGSLVVFNREFARNARARASFTRLARVSKRLAKAMKKVRA